MNAEMYLITNQLKHALDWILLERQKLTWKKCVKNLSLKSILLTVVKMQENTFAIICISRILSGQRL